MSSERRSRRFGGTQALEGPGEVILGAELDDFSVAIKYPSDDPPREGELPEILQDAGEELDHFASVRGLALGEDLDDQDDDDPELVTDGGSPIFRAVVEVDGIERDEYVRAPSQSAAATAVLEKWDRGYIAALYELADPEKVDEDELLEAPELVTDGGVAHANRSAVAAPWPRLNRALSFAFIGAVLIHGPIDVLLTTAAFQLEANSLVRTLGVPSWIAVKVAVLSIASFAWYDARRFNPEPYVVEAILLLGVLAGFGLALVLQNVVTLAGVLG